MPALSSILTPNEILKVKYIMKLFNGRVTRVTEKGQYEEERKSKINREMRKTYPRR